MLSFYGHVSVEGKQIEEGKVMVIIGNRAKSLFTQQSYESAPNQCIALMVDQTLPLSLPLCLCLITLRSHSANDGQLMGVIHILRAPVVHCSDHWH